MGAHSKITGQKYLPVGINAESWTENMGISHEYHSAPRRRTRGGISGKLRLAGVIVAILLVAYAVTAILEKGTAEEESTPQTGAGGIAQNILAPLPMQGEAASGSGSEGAADSSSTAQAVQLESFGPARQTDGAYTIKAYDASVIRQSACGQVDLSYFSDAAFLCGCKSLFNQFSCHFMGKQSHIFAGSAVGNIVIKAVPATQIAQAGRWLNEKCIMFHRDSLRASQFLKQGYRKIRAFASSNS